MGAAAFALLAQIALGLAVLAVGALTAWVSNNAVKRVVGVGVCVIAAMLVLAALGAPAALIVAAAGILLAVLALGAALVVRLQETYAGVEAHEFDAADRTDEPVEPLA